MINFIVCIIAIVLSTTYIAKLFYEWIPHKNNSLANQNRIDSEYISSLKSQNASLNEKICEYRKEISMLNDKNSHLNEEILNTRKQLFLTVEEKAKCESRCNTQSDYKEIMQNTIEKALSSKMYKHLDDFKKSMREAHEYMFKDGLKDISNLTSEILTTRKSIEDFTKITIDTSKNLGKMGEAMLKRSLEISGFKEGVDFETEKHFDDIGRPDCIMNLWSNKVLVIDAKNSINLISEDSCPKKILSSYKFHLKNLSEKRYDRIPNSMPYIVMFIPNEKIINCQYYEEIIKEAYVKNIVIATPSTLRILITQMIANRKIYEMSSKIPEIIKCYDEINKSCQKICVELLDAINKEDKAQEARKNIYKRIATHIPRKILKASKINLDISQNNLLEDAVNKVDKILNLEDVFLTENEQ